MAEPGLHTDKSQSEVSELVNSLLPVINTTNPNPEKLREILDQIEEKYSPQTDLSVLLPLAVALKSVKAEPAKLIFNSLSRLLSSVICTIEFAAVILRARDESVLNECVELLVCLAEEEKFYVDNNFVEWLAAESMKEKSRLNGKAISQKLSKLIGYFNSPDENSVDNPLMYLYLNGPTVNIKLYAASLLDSEGQPADESTAQRLLGNEKFSLLSGYLAYTRAAYRDLLYIKSSHEFRDVLVNSIKAVEKICGPDLIKEIITNVGWENMNLGLEAERLREVSVGGELPIYIREPEIRFLRNSIDLGLGEEVYKIVAHHSPLKDPVKQSVTENPVARFRSYNLTHAELLRDILDITPLNRLKINRILKNMDKVVKDYVALFSEYSQECLILPDIYLGLKKKIEEQLKLTSGDTILSREITRLVQMFEEPKSVSDVTTIHGLKRYLHQKGLKHGFKLVEKGQSPNRSIDLFIAGSEKSHSILRNIHYADFEPMENSDNAGLNIPYPVRIVINGFQDQMLYGLESFPRINIFCYANEIHYYPWFRNHPVFIRIDFSPPLQGGMIDLEYYGVSNYELDNHPNLELSAIKKLFAALEFDVQMEGTRIHARYDKEVTVDFGQLCEKAEMLFRLVPYMMDLDWIIGSLDYGMAAKEKIIDAWIESFLDWGVLPVKALLSEDNLKVLHNVTDEHDAETVTEWNGNGDYTDKFTANDNADSLNAINDSLDELRIDFQKVKDSDHLRRYGKLYLEKRFLRILRDAIRNGEIHEENGLYVSTHEELFKRISPPELIAELISSNDGLLRSAAITARLILPLERSLSFQTIGNIEHLEVQATKIPLLGENINLCILRCTNRIIRLAAFSHGNGFYKYRKFISDRWINNWSCDAKDLAHMLRKNNYVVPFAKPSEKDIDDTILHVKLELDSGSSYLIDKHYPGQRIIEGLQASPGKAAGKALLGISSRMPEDFDGAILFSESITPRDNTYLYHSSGIVSTGGGILSHAGLIAIQFKKPAMVIKGEWRKNTGGGLSLLYSQTEYREVQHQAFGFNIITRSDLFEKQYELNDGDLVILEASKGRMLIIGQQRDAMALYDGFKMFGKICVEMSVENSDILSLRGRLLKAQYHIEKILERIYDPFLARYAVNEILMGDLIPDVESWKRVKVKLLKILLENENTGEAAGEYLRKIIDEMYGKYTHRFDEVVELISQSNRLNEIISLRLEAIKMHELEKTINEFLAQSALRVSEQKLRVLESLEKCSLERLEYLFENTYENLLNYNNDGEEIIRCQHLLRTIDRLALVLEISAEKALYITTLRRKLNETVESAINLLKGKYILTSNNGGIELCPLIGGKAANLAELNRLIGEDNVSPWFAVTNKAFQDVLDYKLEASKSFVKEIPRDAVTIRDAIEKILERNNLSDSEKSQHINKLWDSVKLPEELYREIEAALYSLTGGNTDKFSFFAVRSSSLEEDTEAQARAGEFDTFLFVKGLDQIISRIKSAWAGLWTERAIHNRKILGRNYEYKGGIIVQKIIWARVSGVIQTINVARGKLSEVVINAGLGIGEGIVSGVVAADQVTVAKKGYDPEKPLQFTYATADKKERVVYDDEKESGTKIDSTLYHQRFRAALEYAEISELVNLSLKLEGEYGYPLDIEYALEGNRIWIMQVRPVATFLAAFNDTVSNYPVMHR